MSGVSGYEDFCGKRDILECPYSVCEGCPIKENFDEFEAWRKINEKTCKMDKAYWDDGQSTWGCKCSSCGRRFEYETGIAWDYCPHCGARVVGDKE